MKFVTSCVKWLVLCFWLCAGTISFLAAQNLSRQLESAKAEVANYKSQAEFAADEGRRVAEVARHMAEELKASGQRLVDAQELRDAAMETATKWRLKFEAICQQVQSLSVDATAFTE
jgi:hypothetical protein